VKAKKPVTKAKVAKPTAKKAVKAKSARKPAAKKASPVMPKVATFQSALSKPQSGFLHSGVKLGSELKNPFRK
jgi:hypothetical protein